MEYKPVFVNLGKVEVDPKVLKEIFKDGPDEIAYYEKWEGKK